ncbi:MAG: hypothetical protein GX580_10990 [Candidatus Hydrogenedens sp.]|nr:hypothetical protein [Candidatus Hydrogenedentota bacterium]NLF58153.1 hypothetical protein [Candidatus Hydrogenedens sp.]
MFLEILSDIWTTVQSQIINIPVDNALGFFYIILNLGSLIVMTLLGYSGTGGSLFGK